MKSIAKIDPIIHSAIKKEINRQKTQLVMIASENYASSAVLEATGSVMTNKYAEGYPGRRYYAGCENFDTIENIAINRANELFSSNFSNVQPHSGTQANMAAYFSLVNVGSKIMSMSLDHGGHLSHGSSVNFSGKLYDFIHYGVDPETEQLDYDEIEKLAKKFTPDLIITGYTAYPREINFKRFKEISDEVESKLLVDMSHISGLIAGNSHSSPIDFADLVTSTTHKTLRGPRGAMALSNNESIIKKFNSGVFPNTQGGPMGHSITAKAVAFYEAIDSKFSDYAKQIVINSRTLAQSMENRGFKLVSNGTDTHMILVDLRTKSMSGMEAERYLKDVGIIVNKNTIPFDPNPPMITSGIRIGTAALTTRGLVAKDMDYIGDLIYKTLTYCDDNKMKSRILNEVKEFSESFPVPGIDT
ncbi:MAG: serine hydroxymethyltransferase [Chloroflexi bacterium]|nr:serine hydroxymethyltransferase [Chloroflexota bacterium]